jgi:hypothetical protein
VNTDPLAPDEPLSPELVLVLPPELRAQALARLGPPAWPAPRPRPRAPAILEPAHEPFVRALATVVGARLVSLTLIFLAVTIVTLALTVVAQAIR